MLIVLTFLPGMAGGLVRGLIGITKHVSQKKEPFRPHKLLFTLLTAMLVGAVAGVATDGDMNLILTRCRPLAYNASLTV